MNSTTYLRPSIAATSMRCGLAALLDASFVGAGVADGHAVLSDRGGT